MADTTLSYTIPEAKVVEYIADYVYVHKNTEQVDPDDNDSALKYTDTQWVREHILRYVISQIKRGKQSKYRDAAEASDVSDVT